MNGTDGPPGETGKPGRIGPKVFGCHMYIIHM